MVFVVSFEHFMTFRRTVQNLQSMVFCGAYCPILAPLHLMVNSGVRYAGIWRAPFSLSRGTCDKGTTEIENAGCNMYAKTTFKLFLELGTNTSPKIGRRQCRHYRDSENYMLVHNNSACWRHPRGAYLCYFCSSA